MILRIIHLTHQILLEIWLNLINYLDGQPPTISKLIWHPFNRREMLKLARQIYLIVANQDLFSTTRWIKWYNSQVLAMQRACNSFQACKIKKQVRSHYPNISKQICLNQYKNSIQFLRTHLFLVQAIKILCLLTILRQHRTFPKQRHLPPSPPQDPLTSTNIFPQNQMLDRQVEAIQRRGSEIIWALASRSCKENWANWFHVNYTRRSGKLYLFTYREIIDK